MKWSLKDTETFRALIAETITPPRAHAPPQAVRIDYLDSQIHSTDDYLIDPDYPIDSWLN